MNIKEEILMLDLIEVSDLFRATEDSEEEVNPMDNRDNTTDKKKGPLNKISPHSIREVGDNIMLDHNLIGLK
jgi:hypothetical protein